MSRSTGSMRRWSLALLATAALAYAPTAHAQAAQKIDQEYTAQIKKDLSDPRVSTELVDHLPASATVPTPLKFLGHIIGAPGYLDHNEDINRYLEAVAKASGGRAKYWVIGKSEEGREMSMFVVGDAQTIANLDKYKGYLHELTDPRKTSEARAKQVIHTAKPIYWITSGMHSPESGGPEMLMELAYRLVVEESPLIQNVRNNVITMITPVIETDGRDAYVDNHYFNLQWEKDHPSANGAAGGRGGPLPLMYWGKYVQHDDNRDGMGQFLDLTKNTTKTFLEWTPTILHDLHEAQTYLYASTGTGPYNDALDPIIVDQWWYLAKNDVMEMTKRGVPGVWTYGFYDGWVPNYLFFIAHTHNAVGRFYEVQSYCGNSDCSNYAVKPGNTTTSKEWFRPNPPLDSILWSPRANTNIQESAILFALNRVTRDKDLFLENYWDQNKWAVNKGKTGPVYAWVIPANQHARENAADAVNELKLQGLEFNVASTSFTAGKVQVHAGDYIVRGDQPYRTIADMYFALQNFPPDNPSPYDDTGWTFPLMRNITVDEVTDPAILRQPMTMIPMAKTVVAAGGISGSGSTVVVPNNSDNTLVSLRFKFPKVAMQAAEAAFDVDGHHVGAGAIIIANANRAQLEPELVKLGLDGYALAAAPPVKTHELTTPRIGYIHSWSRTQDEGWVRAAFDTYGVPYHYFGENAVAKMGDLRAKYDVIIYPAGGAGVGNAAGGRGGRGGAAADVPIPFKRTKQFPALGYPDSTDDIRGALGDAGMKSLYAFVQHGGTLITEGNTSGILPELNLTPGVKLEQASALFARGTILRGQITDATSPLVYGYDHTDVPVYFSQAPVLNAGAGAQPIAEAADAGAAAAGRGGRAGSIAQNTTPMANLLKLSAWDPDHTGTAYGLATSEGNDFNVAQAGAPAGGRGGRAGFGGGRGGFGAAPTSVPGLTADPNSSTRVVVQFPENASDMLLSGTLEHGELLSKRAGLVDETVGQGHVVMFAFRPYWRWQTQGTFAMGFNAIVNWNHLDAGR